jgi:hypothetical protein
MRTFRTPAFYLVLILALSVVTPIAGQATVRVFVDGDQVVFDQPPIIVGSRVLVPLRGIFERMGATVVWIQSTRTVRAQRGTTSVELQIGSRNAVVNGRTVILDVPAQIVGGRTLVPLRFISESLGAGVEYDPASRTVQITTGGAGQPPAPSGQTTIKGIIIAVSPGGDQPSVTVESGNVAYRIRVTADTVVTRVDAATGAGGSVALASLRRGDDAEVTMSGNTATRIRATYLAATGRIEAIARASRTLVLTDGRTYRYASEVTVLVNDRPASNGINALAAGQTVELRLNPTSREAWEINIVSGAAAQITLEIIRPDGGDVVSSPVRVIGTTAPGAQVVISVLFQGDVMGRRTVTASSAGRFDTTVSFTIRRRNATYVVSVTANHPNLGRIQKRVSVTVR